MKKEYDLAKMPLQHNPYFAALSQECTLRVGRDVVSYFDRLSTETGIEAQVLMAAYLRECVVKQLRPDWGLPTRSRVKRA